jgi:hypothetical protein
MWADGMFKGMMLAAIAFGVAITLACIGIGWLVVWLLRHLQWVG